MMRERDDAAKTGTDRSRVADRTRSRTVPRHLAEQRAGYGVRQRAVCAHDREVMT
jgi:hypothetical protein